MSNSDKNNISVPQKNTIKTYVENGFYHVYNRGVDKRKIFKDVQDYNVFLSYLKTALSPPPKKNKQKLIKVNVKGVSFTKLARPPKNFRNKVELLVYCLMSNHFHLLIKQKSRETMEAFMRSILTRYSMYFNKKYERIGPLFSGTYKAVLITKDSYLLHLSRYIHQNPFKYSENLIHAYSSYANYLGLKNTPWVKPDFVLSYFNNSTIPELKKINTYKNFVEKNKNNSSQTLGDLTLE